MAKVYCRYPFTHLYSDSYHMMMPCCYAVTDHPYKSRENTSFKSTHLKDGAYEFFKSEQMSQLRLDMMKSDPLTPLVKDVCRDCIAAEEARELCIPIVTLGIGSLTERVKHGITGFIAKNYEEFAYYTLKIFEDKILWKRLRNNLIKIRGTKKWNSVAINLLKQIH